MVRKHSADGSPLGRATIDDVARRAGVSKATVSRFLNRRDALLTREIAARVERAIADLAYTPSPMAQALKRGHSRLVGLVVADVANPFSIAMLRGAQKACQESGYLVMLFNLGNEGEREREAIEALGSYGVEGFILHTLGADGGAAADTARHGKPVVLVDRRHAGMQADFVSLDNDAAVRLGAGHLVDAGYGELLYATEPVAGVSSRRERTRAFEAFGAERGVAASVCEFADPAALPAALVALRERAGERPPAVLASNAVTTLRIAEAVSRLGWRFGSDLGFVGFDDTDWAALVGPGLSAIAQPTDEMGREAVRCLLQRVAGSDEPPRQTLLPARLVERGSSRRE